MPLNDLEQSLEAMDAAFAKAPAEHDPFALPEPGIYQAVVEGVDFFEAKNPPNDAFLKLQFRIVHDAKYDGRGVDIVHGLEPHLRYSEPEDIQRRLTSLKKDLKTLGVEVDHDDFSLTAVRPGSPLWDDILDAPVELAVVDSKKLNPQTGKPYRNLYLNARLGLPIGSDIPTTPVARPAASSSPDIPF